MAEERVAEGEKSHGPGRLQWTEEAPAADNAKVAASKSLSFSAEVPEDVPQPPENALDRSEMINALKQQVLPIEAAGSELRKSRRSSVSKLLGRSKSSSKMT